MIGILELARQLSQREEPFVLATVVWRRAPSSGRTGAKAVIHADGRMTGWLGGACAGPAVRAEARRALEDGSPRLLVLEPTGELAGQEGVTTLPMSCASEGALGIYLEPVVPQPRLVAVGRSPVVAALVGIARALDWRAVVVDEAETGDDHPGADAVVPVSDLAAVVGERTFVVVATMGHDDERALEAALSTPAPYVGLVASGQRAKAVFDRLRSRGVTEEALGRVHAPAGLDLGHVPHPEIAVAVMAEIVQLKNAGLAGTVDTPSGVEAVDPVCGMVVEEATARHRATHQGVEYLFCCAGCQARFEADPAAHLPA